MNIVKSILTKKPVIICTVLILLAIIGYVFGETRSSIPAEAVEQSEEQQSAVEFVDPATPFLPADEFVVAAESPDLILSVHQKTGHFHITDKRNGQVYRSYPNPDQWENEKASPTWLNHLKSPLMFRYVQFGIQRDLAKLTSLLQEKGQVENFELVNNGFKVTFTIPKMGISVPVEVTLDGDSVETKIIDKGVTESTEFSLAGLRLYPFFGAEQSVGQDGYLFVPDGSGALIRFNPNRTGLTTIYTERIFGADWSYIGRGESFSNRNSISMPVFGIKNNTQGFIGVVLEGAEYADIVSAPSGSLSQYNWTTADFIYRQRYFQTTSTDGSEGFYTYEDQRTGSDRSIRYYILDKGNADYVGMAKRYRQHLMDEQGLKPIQADSDSSGTNVPLHVALYGGDVEKGFFFDSYVPVTTTSQAKEIVNELSDLGVTNMSITYFGWQKGGYSSSGGNLPVDSRIGGTAGMKEFVRYADSMGYPVYLDAGIYGYNNRTLPGKDGFRRQRDAMRNLASNITYYFDRSDDSESAFVSPRFAQRSLYNDFDYFQELGIDGLYVRAGLSEYLNTDFNSRYYAARKEVNELVKQMYTDIGKNVGAVVAKTPSFNLLGNVNHIYDIAQDHSYDVFFDDSVPFAQIALHGLVTYSTSYMNERMDYQSEFLRSIEYGAEPSVVLSYATTNVLLRTKTLSRFYSTHYKDWLVEIVKQYQRYNEALGDVKGLFIENHRTLAAGVKETTYSNGQKVIVNYNKTPYSSGTVVVGPEDFEVIQGGE